MSDTVILPLKPMAPKPVAPKAGKPKEEKPKVCSAPRTEVTYTIIAPAKRRAFEMEEEEDPSKFWEAKPPEAEEKIEEEEVEPTDEQRLEEAREQLKRDLRKPLPRKNPFAEMFETLVQTADNEKVPKAEFIARVDAFLDEYPQLVSAKGKRCGDDFHVVRQFLSDPVVEYKFQSEPQVSAPPTITARTPGGAVRE